ncbi:MAG: Uma2 family endonuclease [Cyanosarcina radialis HA8281-LM2]|jgi:Uma2 family endonuclease|nr:Uma2 family endonuclease [Cyanosarcina radialis HA8281-LM2]
MTTITDRPIQKAPDQLIALKGNWEQFKLIQKGCEGNPGARLFYFDGTIEIVMPGRPHEIFAQAIGILLALFLARQKIFFLAVGSADQEKAGEASAQPDQSYCIGSIKPIPDLSIEVVFSSGGQSKLSRYQAIGVSEVWFWEDGFLALYHLRSDGYERIEQSELDGLKNLDLDVLKRHILMGETNTREAMHSFSVYLETL